jgi:hypothetical protein
MNMRSPLGMTCSKGPNLIKKCWKEYRQCCPTCKSAFGPFRSIDGVFCPKYFKGKKLPSPRSKKAFHQVSSKKAFHQVSIRKHKRREITKRPYRMRKGLHQAKRPKQRKG